MTLQLRALRGATTTTANTAAAIAEAVEELVAALMERTGLSADRLLSVTFSATADLDACFPAAIARRLQGWTASPCSTASRWLCKAICPVASDCWPMPGSTRPTSPCTHTCGRPQACGPIAPASRPATGPGQGRRGPLRMEAHR